MLISIDIADEDLEGDYGTIPGLVITCSRCDHSVEVFGTEESSVKRGTAMLRATRPLRPTMFNTERKLTDTTAKKYDL